MSSLEFFPTLSPSYVGDAKRRTEIAHRLVYYLLEWSLTQIKYSLLIENWVQMIPVIDYSTSNYKVTNILFYIIPIR